VRRELVKSPLSSLTHSSLKLFLIGRHNDNAECGTKNSDLTDNNNKFQIVKQQIIKKFLLYKIIFFQIIASFLDDLTVSSPSECSSKVSSSFARSIIQQ